MNQDKKEVKKRKIMRKKLYRIEYKVGKKS